MDNDEKSNLSSSQPVCMGPQLPGISLPILEEFANTVGDEKSNHASTQPVCMDPQLPGISLPKLEEFANTVGDEKSNHASTQPVCMDPQLPGISLPTLEEFANTVGEVNINNFIEDNDLEKFITSLETYQQNIEEAKFTNDELLSSSNFHVDLNEQRETEESWCFPPIVQIGECLNQRTATDEQSSTKTIDFVNERVVIEESSSLSMFTQIGEFVRRPIEMISSSTSSIGPPQTTATPSTSHSEGETTNENDDPPTKSSVSIGLVYDPAENDIDAAIGNVINSISTEKKIDPLLDSLLMLRVLNTVTSADFHTCGKCLKTFYNLPTFQVHKPICGDEPPFEVPIKLDNVVVNQLARSIWKELVISRLKEEQKNNKIDKKFMQQMEQLHYELDELWNNTGDFMESITMCRAIFIGVAVQVISRKWTKTAVINDVDYKRKIERKETAKKRCKSESEPERELETKTARPKRAPKKPKIEETFEPKAKTRGRKPRNRNKATETDRAVRTLVNDLENDDTSQYSYTLETPVSEHGVDVMIGPPSKTPLLINIRPVTADTPPSVSDSGVDFNSEMDSAIDCFVREDQSSDVEELAKVARGFENLDADDCLRNETAEPELGPNEFVVGDILDRRMRVLRDEDYEYLVHWEGYPDEANTWEPYENLKQCTLKLEDFYDRLRKKAMRNRGGKRF